MNGMKYSIWIEAEEWAEGEWNIVDGNTDAIVTFEDGSRWVGSFFTYKNIQTLADKNKHTGECLHGKYLWGSDMVLVDECSRKRIEEVTAHLIVSGEFEVVFGRCEDEYSDVTVEYWENS
ncbi:hypothetical protein C162_30445 [Paenibacillus sp. FSL R7-269]|uniref:hypothetical protein n=1 Tax=Paenibacillus sp. FSL R7-269 TaxID=1226755 RepID=UPI0003E29757|nr:hypothetical protein [Paenibacillus sp. FSL R7-269]ETT33954.1 hypothetical protein C162_30445 [Paenibacillus sp. FSL R7-269]